MDYKMVIKHFNDGTIDRDKFVVVMDNDGGYWSCIDYSLEDDVRELAALKMEEKYGTPGGYNDVVEILNAAGVNCEWC